MPKVQYTFRVLAPEPFEFKEQDILPPGMDIDLRAKQTVMLWNEESERSGEPERELVSAEIIDPFIHEHEWIVNAGPYVACANCKVTGERNRTGIVHRDKRFVSNHYEVCREEKPKIKPPSFG